MTMTFPKLDISKRLPLRPWQGPMLTTFLISLCSIAMIQPTLAQEALLRTLTVTGQGKVSIPTTKTEIHLGVEVQGKTAAEAQRTAAAKTAAVIKLLRSRNVEKLQTTGIGLNPRYSYNNDIRRLEGFVATNKVSFQVPTEEAGILMDQAVQAGATQINDIRFMAAEAAIDAAQDQAFQAATQDARRQADTVLSSLNLAAQEIVTIQVNGAATPVILPSIQSFGKAAAEAAITPVVAAEQEVRASVTLQIRY